MRYFYIIWLQIIFVSCQTQNRDQTLEEMFGDSYELTHECVLHEDVIWGRPALLHYVDSSVVVYDDMLDHIFTLVDVRHSSDLLRFGKKGQGANEFLQVFSLQHIGEEHRLGVYDVFRRALLSIDLDAVRNRSEDVSHVLTRDTMNSINVISTAFDTYIGIGFYEDGLFKLFDDKGFLRSFFEYPYKDKTEREIPNRVRGMAYQGTIRSNPSRTQLVYAVRSAPIVSFFKISDKGIHEMCQHAFGYPDYKVEVSAHAMSTPQSANNKMGFLDAYATDQYVYLLYSGKNYKNVGMQAFEGNIIYMFDWEGKPVKQLILDTPIKNLCVSSDNSTIYAFGNLPDPTLLKFEIGEEMKAKE